jgi:hypothetical protein
MHKFMTDEENIAAYCTPGPKPKKRILQQAAYVKWNKIKPNGFAVDGEGTKTKTGITDPEVIFNKKDARHFMKNGPMGKPLPKKKTKRKQVTQLSLLKESKKKSYAKQALFHLSECAAVGETGVNRDPTLLTMTRLWASQFGSTKGWRGWSNAGWLRGLICAESAQPP